MVTQADLLTPRRRRVYLVDHNERAQSLPGIEEAEILGVVDHHRVADFQTAAPPLMRVEPVGSTNTIIAKLFREAGLEIPPPIAGVMLGGIVADTLVFRSPTCTADDRRIAEELAERAGVDAETFGGEILHIASNLSDRSPEQLVTADFKEFAFADALFGVGVIETADATGLSDRQPEMLAAMEQVRRRGYTSVLVAIIDVVAARTRILIAGQAEAVAAAFDAPLRAGSYLNLPGIYSRKKQIVPLLHRVQAILSPH